MPTDNELYNILQPIRAEQILWHACQHIDVFSRGSLEPEQADLDAIAILRHAYFSLEVR